MANRIMAWWQSVQDWKKQFEKLFGAKALENKEFKKEELSRYQEILTRKFENLNKDERFSRVAVRKKVRELKKDLYPHPIKRFFVDASGWVRSIMSEKHSNSIDTDSLKTTYGHLDKIGLGNLKNDLADKLQKGYREFDLNMLSVSKSGTVIKNTISFQVAGNKVELVDTVAKCKSDQVKSSISLKYNDESLTADQVANLANGKVIKVNNTWHMLDFNDRDKEGNVPLRKLTIPDFDLYSETKKLPFKKLSEKLRNEIVSTLENGEKVNVVFSINGQKKDLTIEANPLLRKINIYDGGKKVTISDLSEKPKQALKIVEPKATTVNRKAFKI